MAMAPVMVMCVRVCRTLNLDFAIDNKLKFIILLCQVNHLKFKLCAEYFFLSPRRELLNLKCDLNLNNSAIVRDPSEL